MVFPPTTVHRRQERARQVRLPAQDLAAHLIALGVHKDGGGHGLDLAEDLLEIPVPAHQRDALVSRLVQQVLRRLDAAGGVNAHGDQLHIVRQGGGDA